MKETIINTLMFACLPLGGVLGTFLHEQTTHVDQTELAFPLCRNGMSCGYSGSGGDALAFDSWGGGGGYGHSGFGNRTTGATEASVEGPECETLADCGYEINDSDPLIVGGDSWSGNYGGGMGIGTGADQVQAVDCVLSEDEHIINPTFPNDAPVVCDA